MAGSKILSIIMLIGGAFFFGAGIYGAAAVPPHLLFPTLPAIFLYMLLAVVLMAAGASFWNVRP